MTLKVGIDVGGTFTDFWVTEKGEEPVVHKVLSTPEDPSIAVLRGLSEIAGLAGSSRPLRTFAGSIETIVHGTTVTTNATLTRAGACSGLITTAGVRDALEMRRGIREEQYNNRYTNVVPLVPRYCRIGVGGRLDREGREVEPLSLDEVQAAVDLFKAEGVEAVSICFMNAFANAHHEQQAADLVRQALPDAYLSVSSELLPSIRFYERVSTTVLNSYVGPILERYLDRLQVRLAEAGFAGLLLVMQSNGGVMAPDIAREKPALTLLSGPAAGPGAGLLYAGVHDWKNCIVIDMGGTSFEAALVREEPVMVNEGVIDRHRIALPMLGIHTIGAGGGSIGWIDQGGLLRMGPQSAGANPGPAAYGHGGRQPTTTDANLVLGYLDPEYFAGGRMPLDLPAARDAIAADVAEPLGLSVVEAAAGMYRVTCNNMAQGVREITIKRGYDPREFPLVVAGGAGPIHSCLIADELDIPLQIVPRESSILCAVGMLMGDLRHDLVRTFVARLDDVDWTALQSLVDVLCEEGAALLEAERIAPDAREFFLKLDCRYLKQYHEVSFPVPLQAITDRDQAVIASAFHAEYNRLYGYSLEQEAAAVEIINIRLQAVGRVEKPELNAEIRHGADASDAIKGERSVYVFEDDAFRQMSVYDGDKLQHGNRVAGPAIIEKQTTAVFVSSSFDCICDSLGSLVLYSRQRADLVTELLRGDS
ncbi:MAG: hydantoinase/oxoprolinase family protein [Arenicellales bacterium]|jgi:N-methylhydantoinase A|nr:hydantoinase/oxoprolinase family protein [Arenicellales bacterium]MDP6292044.1 hydantoinase/oxoprolinase family protein [Arenicellales bacterium]